MHIVDRKYLRRHKSIPLIDDPIFLQRVSLYAEETVGSRDNGITNIHTSLWQHETGHSKSEKDDGIKKYKRWNGSKRVKQLSRN
jgi:hypothetical protein